VSKVESNRRYYQKHKDRLKKASSDYYASHREAKLVYQAKYERAHKKDKARYDESYRTTNKTKRKEQQRIWHQKDKEETAKTVFAHYGGKCVCPPCGENDWRFLTLSHPNNDGGKQRKELGGHNAAGQWFYKWLIKNNFPTDYKIVVECFCCNMAKTRNGGVCPHVAP
jgi:hypothetical protein